MRGIYCSAPTTVPVSLPSVCPDAAVGPAGSAVCAQETRSSRQQRSGPTDGTAQQRSPAS